MTFDGTQILTRAECALALAEAGLPVFPCDGRAKPVAQQRYPGEPRKSPLTPRGFKDATTDREAVCAWWRQYPQALPGVPTGAASGLFVADADIDDTTGEATGEATLARLGLTAATHRQTAPTRSGGRHFVFEWRAGLPGNSTKGNNGLAGVDIRSKGGYVVAWEPETLIAARREAWLEGPPQALLRALEKRKAKPSDGSSVRFATDDGGGPWRDFNDAGSQAKGWAEKALADEIASLATTRPGGRNDAVNRCAFNLGQIVAGGHLDQARVEAAIWAAAVANGVATEEPEQTRRTITSGLDAGTAQPRNPSDKTDETDKTGGAGGSVGSVGSVGGVAAERWPAADMSLLNPERGAAPELPLEAVFGPRWARWISDAADAKGAPPDYVAAALVATAGSLIGNARWVAPWAGWAEPPVLWAMLVGAPSAGKSPALDAALAPLRALERRLRRDAEAERKAWGERAEAAELAHGVWKAEATKALKDGGDPPPKPDAADPGPEPHVPRLSVNDATVERLGVILEAQPRGTLAMRDELSGWLANMSRYANGGSDKPFWLEAYGGRPFTVERMTREPVRVERLTLGVLGGIQPDRLASLLIKADDDGMLARLLPIWPEPAPIKRPDAAPDEAFAEEAFARLHGLAMPRDEAGEPRPWFVPFSEAARTVLDELRIWARAEETGEAGLLVSFLGKTPGMAVRLALILAYLDWAADPVAGEPEEVTADHFGRAACYVAEYALPMARRAYAEASAPAEERAARRLAKLIGEEGWDTFTIRDVTRRERQGLRRNSDVEPALDVLTQAGWLRSERRGSPTPKGGRPQSLFHVNPDVRGRT